MINSGIYVELNYSRNALSPWRPPEPSQTNALFFSLRSARTSCTSMAHDILTLRYHNCKTLCQHCLLFPSLCQTARCQSAGALRALFQDAFQCVLQIGFNAFMICRFSKPTCSHDAVETHSGTIPVVTTNPRKSLLFGDCLVCPHQLALFPLRQKVVKVENKMAYVESVDIYR